MSIKLTKSYLVLAGIVSGLVVTASANAQAGHPQTQPWGYDAGQQYRPYEAARRDSGGNRIIINGRVVDLGDSASPGSYNSSLSQPKSTQFSRSGPINYGTTLNAVAIGNSIDLRGISNSTLILNQYNYGQQIANVPGKRSENLNGSVTHNGTTE